MCHGYSSIGVLLTQGDVAFLLTFLSDLVGFGIDSGRSIVSYLGYFFSSSFVQIR